jgi:hypothetical protein
MESQGSPTNPSLTGDQLTGCSRHCCFSVGVVHAFMLSACVTSIATQLLPNHTTCVQVVLILMIYQTCA